MRTSKDEYINPLGQIILLSQSEQSEEFIKKQGLKLYNGYDYKNQYWVFNGAKDNRTIEELRAILKKEAKN